MTHYNQMKNVVAWLAESYGFLSAPETLELSDVTDLLTNGDYGYNKSEEEFEELQEEYDLDYLREFWNEGKGWTFSDLAGLFDLLVD